MTEELKQLKEAYCKAESEYWDAKSAYYKYSDGFQYHFYAIDEIDGEWLITPTIVPFCPEPQNAVALYEAYFHYHGDPFVLFTDNNKFLFDTVCNERMVIHCDSERLKEFIAYMDNYFYTPKDDLLKRIDFYIISKNPPIVKHGNKTWKL